MLHVTIEATGASTAEALSRAAADANKVLTAVPDLGLAPEDVTTTGIAANAKPDPRGEPVASVATTSLLIKVQEPQRVGEVVDRLVAIAGDALRLHHVSFLVSEGEELQAVARADAVRRARQAAEQLAAAAGGRLGPLRSLHEGGFGPMSGPMPMPAMAGPLRGPPPMPVQPGESTVRVAVTAVYELEMEQP
jgi:uncharacterized protein YggE